MWGMAPVDGHRNTKAQDEAPGTGWRTGQTAPHCRSSHRDHVALVISFEADGIAIKGVPLDEANVAVDWPVTMITRPASSALGEDNPRATPLPRASSEQLLRAVVFSPAGSPPPQVLFRIDGGPANPMSRIGDHYEAWFNTPNTTSCEIEVEATTDAGVGRDTIQVELL